MGIFDWMKSKRERCPLSPFEVVKRAKNLPTRLEWSRNKHLTVSGPEFWGTHHIFIDDSLKHIIFCVKEDLTTHVFVGIPTWAEEWRKYDREVRLVFSKKINENSLEWKIYQDYVLYKGKMLPPKDISEEPYWGKVINTDEFHKQINDEWIISKIMELYK